MKPPRHFAAIAFAAALWPGVSASIARAAPQAPPASDHPESAGQAVNDAWITTKVKSALATTVGVESMNVSVKTVDGHVSLAGELPSEIEVEKAVAAAKNVKGVRDVDTAALKVK